MEKAKVLEAIYICGHGGECSDCSYCSNADCRKQLSEDVAALLKASEAPKAKYTRIEIYTKKGDLLDYFKNSTEMYCKTEEEYNKKLAYYAKEREIQLVCMFRYEKGKIFCKIKCPVNPLPVKGEFEAASASAIFRFLKANGWTFKQEFYPSMFQ